MTEQQYPSPAPHEEMRRIVRARTMTNLRWFAVGGQAAVTLTVRLGLGFELPIGPIVAAIAVGIWANLYLLFTQRQTRALSSNELTAQLLFDICQISTVLFLTGGIQNPFAVWLVLPSMLAASSLDLRYARLVVGVVIIALTFITAVHFPLPWVTPQGYQWDRVYDFGTWAALMLGVAFTSSYAWQIANEQAKVSAALKAAEQVLAREERLTAVDGLAAAAAHELGTPLATIQVTAKEMVTDLPEGPWREDAELLVSQTQRCQRILKRLSSGETSAEQTTLSLEDLLQEAAKPFLGLGGPAIEFAFDPYSQSRAPEKLLRKAEVVYGLRTLIENAVKFADTRVDIRAAWDERLLTVTIEDDGPGFSESALTRLGEPFSRSKHDVHQPGSKNGLGLGFFIAKTLLERTGAQIQYGNNKRLSGAWLEVTWPLANLVKSAKDVQI